MAKKLKVDIGSARAFGRSDSQIAYLVEKYIERHPDCWDADGSIDEDAIIEWAFQSGLYRPKPVDPQTQLRRRVRRHFGHRYIQDGRGRQVRALIAVPKEEITPTGVKRSFGYYPLFETPAKTIYRGLDMRRGWAGKRVEQIYDDRESYNEFNVLGEKIPEMSFNFDEVLARKKMPTTYPTAAPEDADDEDDSLD